MRLLHTMLRVGHLQRSIDFYTQVLGMSLLRTTERPEQKYDLAFVGYGRNPAHAELELTFNYGTDRYDLGSAYGHIAIGVPDVAATCAAVRDKAASLGGGITREPGPVKGGGTMIAFITDPDGYKIELIERKDGLMYLPRHFEQNDPAALAALIEAHPLAVLVTHSADGSLNADHIPLVFDADAGERGMLRGHVARANAVWRDVQAGTPVMAVFRGAEAYVSPSLYPSKREHGKVVPTWNYAVVHAHGFFTPVDDADWLRAFVGRLTDRHEAPRLAPWQVADAPPDFIDQMVKAIVGIEIAVTRLEGKWKISQNRSAADREGVAQGMRDDGFAEMANLVDRGGGVA